MTIQRPCKFCGVLLTVESDPDCPPEWAASLANMLACNRCADHRVEMTTLMQSVRKVCLNLIQFQNLGKLDPETETRLRKSIAVLTTRVARTVCKFHRINIIYDNDFVEQIFEHPDKSGAVIAAYQAMIRVEARKQKQQHEQRIEPATEPEAILCGSGAGHGEERDLGLQRHGEGQAAMAQSEPNQPAGSPGENQGGGLPEETLLI